MRIEIQLELDVSRMGMERLMGSVRSLGKYEPDIAAPLLRALQREYARRSRGEIPASSLTVGVDLAVMHAARAGTRMVQIGRKMTCGGRPGFYEKAGAQLLEAANRVLREAEANGARIVAPHYERCADEGRAGDPVAAEEERAAAHAECRPEAHV